MRRAQKSSRKSQNISPIVSKVFKIIGSLICVVMFYQHKNVLQYREGWECYPEEGNCDPQQMCEHVSADKPLYSMFRLDADPIRCPFDGEYQFTYRTSSVKNECNAKMSNAHSCTDPNWMMLNFQSCVDQTEATQQRMKCVGQWHPDGDSTRKYVMAEVEQVDGRGNVIPSSREDRFRCYVSFFSGRKRHKNLTGPYFICCCCCLIRADVS